MILAAVRATPSCVACTVQINRVSSAATSTSQSGGGDGDILCDINFTVFGAPLGTTFSNMPNLANNLDMTANYCPGDGELPNTASILCTNGTYVNMFTREEMNGTGWQPMAIAAGIAVAGVAGLLATQVASKGTTTTTKPQNGLAPHIHVNEVGQGAGLGHKYSTPILTQGEADLLNDLNLTPTNMVSIFSYNNVYASKFKMDSLKSWDTAISTFLTSLTTQNWKCYKTKLLLTKSECEESKCFLYSIRDYLDNPVNNRRVQVAALMEDGSSEFNEPSLETDETIVLSKVHFEMPQFRIAHDGKATVRVGAIEKRTNHRFHFDLQLKEASKSLDKKTPTPEEVEQLKSMFDEKKRQYSSKYVMYLY